MTTQTEQATREVTMTVNGARRTVTCEDRTLLVHALRDGLDVKGPRIGCMNGDCGACSIQLDGQAVKSCLILAASAEGSDVVTIEGFSDDPDTLDPLQEAVWRHDGFQCGFCISGALMAGRELLQTNPHPTEPEIRSALLGNICRCTGYQHMVDAIAEVASNGDVAGD